MRDVAAAVNALRQRRPGMALLIITHYRVSVSATYMYNMSSAMHLAHLKLCRQAQVCKCSLNPELADDTHQQRC